MQVGGVFSGETDKPKKEKKDSDDSSSDSESEFRRKKKDPAERKQKVRAEMYEKLLRTRIFMTDRQEKVEKLLC